MHFINPASLDQQINSASLPEKSRQDNKPKDTIAADKMQRPQ
jgi:hypothetical protein